MLSFNSTKYGQNRVYYQMTPEIDRRDVLKGLTIASAGVVAGSTVTAEQATADPAPDPPDITLPPVYCLRLTDILSPPDPGRHFFEFETLNWSAPDAGGLAFVLSAGTGLFAPSPPAFAGAMTDPDGIPLLAGDSDANYPPADGTSGTKTGAINTWETITATPTLAVWLDTDGSDPLPGRDLLGAASTSAACDLVPGCAIDGSDPVVPDPETVDNGAPSTDGLPDNTLDGFVLEVTGFFPGMILSFDWFLLDTSGAFMGTVGPGGEEMAFGTFSIFNAPVGFDPSGPGPSSSSNQIRSQSDGDPGPALFERDPGSDEGAGQSAGVGQRTRSMFTTSSENGGEFMAEAGAALSVEPEQTGINGPILTCDLVDYPTNATVRYCSFDQVNYTNLQAPDNATVGEAVEISVDVMGNETQLDCHVGARFRIDGTCKEFAMGELPGQSPNETTLTVETTFDETGTFPIDIPGDSAQTSITITA
jgi:hypothetical protein